LDKPYSVAVVGIGGVFPAAPNVATYWQNILSCKDATVEVPPERWVDDPRWFSDRESADRVANARVCLLENCPEPKSQLAEPIDRLSRMTLVAAEMALEDAQSELQDRSRVATILASIALPTPESSRLSEEVFLGQLAASLDPPVEVPEPTVSPYFRRVTGRPAQVIANGLGLGGPTLTLDAACASSLYAVKLACDALMEGRADAALAGGANRADTLYTQEGFTALGACSSTGRCSPFDKNGDGLVVGEGAGFLLLKRVEDAVRDGDRVYAVIRGIGLSNDIGGSLLAPQSEGQLRSVEDAYRQAGWSPEKVGLVECHGTGTPKGDQTEFNSLMSFWPQGQGKTTVLGSVKSQIGHLLTGAAAAGLIKVIMAIHHRTLPPMINFETPAKGIDLAKSPFEILDAPRPWKGEGPLRAGVSAFGFGGINGHVLVEEPGDLSSEVTPPPTADREVVITAVSAHFGDAHGTEALLLDALTNDCAATRLPEERFHGAQHLPEGLRELHGAFLEILEVAAGQMRIPPKDMGDVLLQQTLLLAVAARATTRSSLGDKERCRRSGALIGLSLDTETTTYHLRWALRRMLRKLGVDPESLTEEHQELLRDTLSRPLDSTRTLGALGSIVASRAAREFSLGGPSYAISCGELSGVRALEIAYRAIANSEMESCLVGAVDLFGDPRSLWAEDRLHRFTRSERARPFSADGDGPTPAEGAVVLVLKSREAAEADGDRILAVLDGSNSTGGKGSLHRALDSLVPDSEIGYVDFTSKADPQEDADFLAEWERRFQNGCRPTAVGTATSVVGATGACAGLLSIVRCAAALDQKVLPGLGHCPQPLPTGHNAYLPQEASFWWHDHKSGPRRAVAVAVGDPNGGDSSCVVLRENNTQAPGLPRNVLSQALPAHLFCVPSGSVDKLQALAKNHDELAELARSWAHQSNPAGGARGALVARNWDEFQRGLSLLKNPPNALDGQAGVFYAPQQLEGKTAWVFPGSGNHYVGMGRELATLFPEVASEICAESELCYQHFFPWLTQPFSSDRGPGWEERALAAIDADPLAPIFSQVTYAILATRVIQRFLPQPDSVIGYSLGETAALFATGAWTERDDMFSRTCESGLFTEHLRGRYKAAEETLGCDGPFDWCVAVLNRDRQTVLDGIKKQARDDLFLLIVNTPQECVVGGSREAVDALTSQTGAEAFYLDGVPTVHCKLVECVRQSYFDLHVQKTTPPPGLTFYNGHRAQGYVPTAESAAQSITDNALHGFSFPDLIEQAYADGVRRFIEIGPGGSSARMVRTILDGREHWSRSASLPREGGEMVSLLKALAGAYVQGLTIDLRSLYGSEPESVTELSRPKVQVRTKDSLPRPHSPPLPWKELEPPRPELSPATPPVAKPAPVRQPATAIEPKPAPAPVYTPTVESPSQQPAPISPPRVAVTAGSRPQRALVWKNPQRAALKTLIKDQEEMNQPQPTDLQPVIGLHPHFEGDPSAQIAASIVEGSRQTALAHESYLALMDQTRQKMEELIRQAGGQVATAPAATVAAPAQTDAFTKIDPSSSNPVMRGERPQRENLAFDRDMCMEFAIGSVAKVLGPRFAPADSNSVRVRLPDEPLMLCDRILEVEGEPCSLGAGRLVTEHDVFPEAWYLDHDRAPVCISVEAGQADLFLCSYLGIDLATDGTRAYRLLDATVAFHRGLPEPGETIKYDIRINKFVQQGEVYLFFFEFDGTINGEPLITMRNGCAGFHTYEEIASSGGIVMSPLERESAPGVAPVDWTPPAPFPYGMDVSESYSDAQIEAFRDGDLAGCFGAGFANLPLANPYRLPRGRMKLFDRVLSLEPKGGRFGLGRIQAEADIHPDDWFLTCHFKDDMVMPGTLMYECCAQTLRFLLARMGWVAETEDVAFEPRLNTPAQLKCRGPVTVETKKVLYQVDIKEIGFCPEPYVITDALMFGDGKAIVRFVDMSLKLTGLDSAYIDAIWGRSQTEIWSGVPSEPQVKVSYDTRPAIYDKESIMQFSNGKPSLAFGPEYTCFDQDRRIARLPGPPYQFMDRVVEADHPKFVLQKGGWIEAHYDVPPDEWYFGANRQDSMAYCILLEAALQPCGWLAAYAGSALRSEEDLKFRNLGGTATLIKEVWPNTGTIRMRVRMSDVNEAGGMIIENYDMQVYAGEELIYDGTTYFGFFSAQALAKQLGVRDAAERTYLPTDADWASYEPQLIPVARPMSPDDPHVDPAPSVNMPAKALLMMDQVDLFLPNSGGTHNMGYIRGSKQVDPDEWFFKAHFYMDPVWPGSLGLEAFLQLLRHAALEYWPELTETHRIEPIAVGLEHTWAYRGQVIPTNKNVVVDVSITRKEDGDVPLLVGAGFLRVDGTPIYEMFDFGIRLVRER
jgi:acyl transferase domain-containing protein/3-hydroxymyristoyl/3-hydroxydecanoyl-(acyl carrier protein) dehydratase